MPTFKPGDRVAYSRKFVKGPGACLKDIADRRATVVRLAYPVPGKPREGFYALFWDGDERERVVLSTNLVHADKLHTEPA